MSKPFVLYRNTKSRCDNEQESDVMDRMEAESELIDYEEFAENCEFETVAAELGYDDDLTLEGDWHVGYSKSNFGGLPCYILAHSECDFIFLKPEDAKMLAEHHGQEAMGMSDMEWQRHTGYGKNRAVDPS